MTPNLSSRLGQWNSKDTRSRLRSVAEKRLRANSLGPKISTPSTSIKSTTVVQSRGEEGLLTEGSEPELTQIRTQTSRSIVMRRSRIKQQKEGSSYYKHFHVVDFKHGAFEFTLLCNYSLLDFKRFHNSAEPNQPSLEARIEPTSPAALRRTAELLDTFSARRPSRRVIAVLGNITRATPSGVTRFPAGHRLAINTPPNSIKAEESPVLKI